MQELPSRGATTTEQGCRNHRAGVQEPLRRASQSCRESIPCCKAVGCKCETEAIRSVGECRESRTCVSCGWGAEWTHCCGKRGQVALPQKNLKTERCSNPSSGHGPERLDSSDPRRGQSRQIHAQVWSVLTSRCHSASDSRCCVTDQP